MKNTLYLMRHGQTLFNQRRKIQGFCDSPLTELGIRQAREAAKFLAEIPLDHAYCSTAERSSDTIELVLNNRLPYTRMKGLREMSFGVFEGESEDLHPSEFEDMMTFYVPFGGESGDEVAARMTKTLQELLAQPQHENVLVVSHGGACMMFASQFAEQVLKSKTVFPNCSILKIEHEDGTFKLLDIIHTCTDLT